MSRVSKEEYYLNIAKTVAERSTCLRRRYGCIIVKNDEIIATGYNGSARGEINCCDIHNGKCPRSDEPHNTGDYSNCPAVHAEQNAMLSAARKDMIGATMYLDGEERKWSEINQSYFRWMKGILLEHGECINHISDGRNWMFVFHALYVKE